MNITPHFYPVSHLHLAIKFKTIKIGQISNKETMRINIEYTAHLNLKDVKNRSEIVLEKPITISQFLADHNIPPIQQKYIIPTVNKEQVSLSYLLSDRDEVFLYLPVGGG